MVVILLPLSASKQRQEHRDKGRGQVGAELAVMYDMPVGFFHCKDTICLLISRFQFMTQRNRTGRNFLEYRRIQGSQL